MNVALLAIAVVFYVLGTVLHWIAVVNGSKAAAGGAKVLVPAGFTLHTGWLIARTLECGHFPVTGVIEGMSFSAWACAVLLFVLDQRLGLGVFWAFVLPIITCVTAVSAYMMPECVPLPPVLRSRWLGIHGTVSLASYGIFAITFAAGIMYLILESDLKRKKLNSFYFRLPALGTVDGINYAATAAGFFFLTAGLITGSFWAQTAWGRYWGWDPKETWALITWLIYAVQLHARLVAGWRGRKTAYLSIAGFAASCFTLVGVSFLLAGRHSY